MRVLQTSLLYHALPGRPHWDWLLVHPGSGIAADRPLYAFRSDSPWWEWPERRRIALTALPLHRRRYLTWQGELSGGRGWVRQAGQGRAVLHRWSPRHLNLDLLTPRGRLSVLVRLDWGSRWTLLIGD